MLKNIGVVLITLKQPIDGWDALIVPIIVGKLARDTIGEWETKINVEKSGINKIPMYVELIDFF